MTRAFSGTLRIAAASAVVLSVFTISLALLEEEGGRPVAAAIDPGSWGAVRTLLDDTGVLESLESPDPAGGPGVPIDVFVYPTTVGGLAEAGRAAVVSGAEALRHFRVEGIANLYVMEHVRSLGLRPERTYIAVSDPDLRDAVDAALRRRFGGEAVRIVRGNVPGNYVLETVRGVEEVARTPVTLLPAEVTRLSESLRGAVLVLSTAEEAGRLPDLAADVPLRGLALRGEAVLALHDPAFRRLLSSLGLPVVLPEGRPAPRGVRAVRAARIPAGASSDDAVDLVYRTRARLAVFESNGQAMLSSLAALREAGYRLGDLTPPSRLRGLLVLPMIVLWPAFLALVAESLAVRPVPVFCVSAAAAVGAHLLVGPDAAVAGLAAVVAGAGGAWGLLRWEEAGPGASPPLVEAATVVSLTAAAAVGAVGLAALDATSTPWPDARVLLLAAAAYVAAQFAVGVPPGRPARTALLLGALAAWTALPSVGPFAEHAEAAAAPLLRWGLTPRRLLVLAGGAALYARVAHLGERARFPLSLLAVLGQAALLLEVAEPSRPLVGRVAAATAFGAAGPFGAALLHAAARWYLDRPDEDEEDEEPTEAGGA